MTEIPIWRIALERFVDELRTVYGDHLATVFLYGSRARRDPEEASDIDTLVVLSPCKDFWAEFARIGAVANRLSLDHDVVISAIPVDLGEFNEGGGPLFINVRREGVRVG